MNGYSARSVHIAACVIMLALIAGCAHIPLRDGELVVGKDTTATIDDIGVGRVNSRF